MFAAKTYYDLTLQLFLVEKITHLTDLKVLMGFIAVLPILLFLPHIPIIPEEAMYPSVEKKPRTTCNFRTKLVNHARPVRYLASKRKKRKKRLI